MKKYIDIALVALMLTGILFSCNKSESIPSVKDIYLAGYEYNGTCYIAKYWKNGADFALTDGKQDAMANFIGIFDNNIFVAGNEYNGVNYVAKYWKNGTPVALTDGSHSSEATSIVVYGNDIYVSGYENIGTKNVATYWKNGVAI